MEKREVLRFMLRVAISISFIILGGLYVFPKPVLQDLHSEYQKKTLDDSFE